MKVVRVEEIARNAEGGFCVVANVWTRKGKKWVKEIVRPVSRELAISFIKRMKLNHKKTEWGAVGTGWTLKYFTRDIKK